MKKFVSILSMLAMLLTLLPLGSLAVAAEADAEYDYNYLVLDDEVTIMGYTGAGGDIAIPATLGGFPVTAIGTGAFEECARLTSVVIPDGVVTIDDMAFYGCYNLTSVTIPEGVEFIGWSAFRHCDKLSAVIIPDSVTTIGGEAFDYCISLTSVVIGDGVTTIDDLTFYNCSSLTSLTIGDNVTTIGQNAFSECDSLTTVTIPDSVTFLGWMAFRNCDNLSTITIPDSVVRTESSVFAGCKSMTSATIGKGITTIGKCLFQDCTSLTSLTLGESVTGISQYAFDGCTSLSDVYYAGTEEGKAAMNIEDNNAPLLDASWHYDSESLTIVAESSAVRYAQEGATVTATVTASGEELSYTWYLKNAGQSKYSKSVIKTATYSTVMSDKANGRCIYCVVKDKNGNSVQSKVFTLREQVSIIAEPSTVRYAKKGAKVSAKITASGDGLKYTWYIKNAGTTEYIPSVITSATYSTTMGAKAKDRQIYCVVKDKYGHTIQTKTFTLREQVSITAQPKTVTVARNKTAKVSVKASGDGLKYTWYIKNAGSSKYSKSSITKSTYSVKMTGKAKNRQIYCVVKDKYGKTVKTNTVRLKMK